MLFGKILFSLSLLAELGSGVRMFNKITEENHCPQNASNANEINCYISRRRLIFCLLMAIPSTHLLDVDLEYVSLPRNIHKFKMAEIEKTSESEKIHSLEYSEDFN